VKWWTVYEDDHGVQCQAVDEKGQWAQRRDVEALESTLASKTAAFHAACQTVADMHRAAVGSVRGPINGVVEDVVELKRNHDNLVDLVKQLREKEGKDAMRILFLEGKYSCDGCRHNQEEDNETCARCSRDAINNTSDLYEK